VGAGRFLDDLHQPNLARLAHLGVVRSLHAHGRVVKMATAEAPGQPGVLAVFRGDDLPEVATPILPPYGKTPHTRPFAQPVLAKETVRYVKGDPSAAQRVKLVSLVATPWRAVQGAALVTLAKSEAVRS